MARVLPLTNLSCDSTQFLMDQVISCNRYIESVSERSMGEVLGLKKDISL